MGQGQRCGPRIRQGLRGSRRHPPAPHPATGGPRYRWTETFGPRLGMMFVPADDEGLASVKAMCAPLITLLTEDNARTKAELQSVVHEDDGITAIRFYDGEILQAGDKDALTNQFSHYVLS
eukprot:SAG31_NODE_1090_length_9967_cov_66.880726_6_plen_121_part_00